eukprot:COSAG02_NODE_39512_length_416_cov_0.817035_1_plen_75_part_01
MSLTQCTSVVLLVFCVMPCSAVARGSDAAPKKCNPEVDEKLLTDNLWDDGGRKGPPVPLILLPQPAGQESTWPAA